MHSRICAVLILLFVHSVAIASDDADETNMVPIRVARETNDAGFAITFSGPRVTARSLKRGATVVFFAAGLDPLGYTSVIKHWNALVTDDDGDGIATFQANEDIPQKSIWVVADLNTGDYVLAAPAGFQPRVIELKPNSFRKNTSSGAEQFAFDAPYLDLLYVHPGQGAWTWSDLDGTATDNDGPNGLTTIDVSQARPLVINGGRPKELKNGGILIAINFVRMEVLATRLTPALFGGER